MIPSTSLLSLPPSLPQGAARSSGGAIAFVLPDEGAGDPATTVDDGQDDAAGGNPLPAGDPAAIDPWLIATVLAPTTGPTTPPPPTASGDAAAPAVSPSIADRPPTPFAPFAARATLTPTPDATSPSRAERVVDEASTPLANAASSRRMAELPPPAMPPGTVAVPPPTTRPAEIAMGPPSALAGSPSDAVPAADDELIRAASRKHESGPAATHALRPPATAGLPTSDVSLPPTHEAPDPAVSPGLGAATILPAAALATSSLTPLRHREIAAVATTIERVGASALLERSDPPVPTPTPTPTAAMPDVASKPPTNIAEPTLPPAQELPSRDMADAAAPPTAMRSHIAASPSTQPLERASTPALGTLPLGWRLSATSTLTSSSTAASATDTFPAVVSIGHTTEATRRAIAPAPPSTTAMLAPVAGPIATLEPFAAAPGTPPGLASPVAGAGVSTAMPNGDAVPLAIPPTPVAPTPPITSVSPTSVSDDRSPAPPPATAPPSQAPTVSIAPAAQPSAIVFGAARYAAQSGDRREDPLAPAAGIAPPIPAPHGPVAAPAPQAPLDVRHERWPTAMIERIEMIHDAVNAADTRIRLAPDALGPIDVDVRREGDTLHVRFTAVEPQTRALLQDAAPRLADAAEARGLRLSQSTVGADAGGLAQHQQQGRQQPLAPAPTRTPRSATEATTADVDDARLA